MASILSLARENSVPTPRANSPASAGVFYHMTTAAQKKLNKLLRLHTREQGRCFYCGVRVNLHTVKTLGTRWPDARAATMDHIIPRSAGGGSTEDNLVLACYGCNNRRSDQPASDFLASLQQESQPC
jgi:5-methylcytosine-specific restriction endonuclease McrA